MTPNSSRNDEPACPLLHQLHAYQEGLLPEKDEREIASHLEKCSSCRLLIEGSPITAHSHTARTETIDFPLGASTSEGECRRDDKTSSNLPANATLPEKLGQYELQGVIGRGGMGIVCKGWHTRLKRPVAIKFLHPSRCSQSGIGRFIQEMEAIGRLDHPNIVRALDADEKDGYHFLVMELLDGLTISALVARTGRLPVAAACEVIRQAAMGMQYAHEQKMVHRDIKPSNLLLTFDGTVKILDLGLALLRRPAPLDERLTDLDEVMGTADYMSPEQGANCRDVDIRADIYSLGCTLYMLLSGAPPFAGLAHNSLYKKIESHTREPVPSLRKHRGDVSVEVVRIVERMLAKAPADRYATPKAVADALAPFARRDDLASLLQQAMSGSSLNPGSGSSATTPDAPPPSNRLWRVAAACACLLVLVVLGAWFFGTGNPHLVTDPPSDTLTPDVSHQMLLKEPKSLFPKQNGRWRFDAGKRELWVDTTGTALFQLGETDADDYEIEVFVHQSQWNWGFGVFFGYRESDRANEESIRYQFVQLGTNALLPPQRDFRLDHKFYRRDPDGTEEVLRLATGDIPVPGKIPISLRLTVAKGRLQKVTWDGKDLPDLLRALPDIHVDPPDSRGAFGLFAHSCAVMFRDAQFLYRKGNPRVQP
jgi:eukaryotic-like serine/threonine-protein kinase